MHRDPDPEPLAVLVMRPLTWKECVVGAHVQISDTGHLRQELQLYENADMETMPVETCVTMFAGQRAIVVNQPKSRLQILETDGRVVCQLLEKSQHQAILPVSVLWEDEKMQALHHEREMACCLAADMLQKWWRKLLLTRDTAAASNASDVHSADLRCVPELPEESMEKHPKDVPQVDTTRNGKEEVNAAVRIQSRVRAACARHIAVSKARELAASNELKASAEVFATRVIQRNVRGWLVMRELNRRARDRRNERIRVEAEAEALKTQKMILLRDFLRASQTGNSTDVAALVPHVLTLLTDGVDSTDKDGSTALALACENGHLATAKLLFAHNANPNHANNAGWTPLHRACFGGHAPVVRWLATPIQDVVLKASGAPNVDAAGAGVDISVCNNRGSCATHACVPGGHVRVLRLISDASPEGLGMPELLDVANLDGDTPLHFAVMCRQLKIVRFLISRGISMVPTNKDGLTALQLAEKNGENAIVTLLCAAMRHSNLPQSHGGNSARSCKKTKRVGLKTTHKTSRSNGRSAKVPRSWGSCLDARQALTFAWKFASEDSCRELSLNHRDIRIILSGLAVLDEERVVAADAKNNITGEQQPSNPSRPEVDDEDAHPGAEKQRDADEVWIDLTSAGNVAKSLTSAATYFALPLKRRLSTRRARLAQKRLLDYIRSPAAALRHIYDAGGKVSEWCADDIDRLLLVLRAPVETLPKDVRRNGQTLLQHARMALCRPVSPKFMVACPSSLLRARVLFHLSVVNHLGHWESHLLERNAPPPVPAATAGSGAAHALALQRGTKDATAKMLASHLQQLSEAEAPAVPEPVFYRPPQSSRAIQRAVEVAELEAERKLESHRPPPTPIPHDVEYSRTPSTAITVNVAGLDQSPIDNPSLAFEVVGLGVRASPRPPLRCAHGTMRNSSYLYRHVDEHSPSHVPKLASV